MPLIAINTANGKEIESFSFTEEEWREMKKAPLGTYSIYNSNWPAIPKTSIKGCQFFAAAPGCPIKSSQGESHEHLSAKIAITKAIRNLGLHAQPEFSRRTTEGEEWRADVYSESTSNPTAFEVQMSSQTLEEYKLRSRRYSSVNVDSLWLIPDNNFVTLSKAIFSDRFRREGVKHYGHPFLPEIRVVSLLITKEEHSIRFAVRVFPEDKPCEQIPLEEFIEGFFQGRLVLTESGWKWRVL